MKKLLSFLCTTILLSGSFYSMQRFLPKKMSKKYTTGLKPKKIKNPRSILLKRYYGKRFTVINPFTFLKKKLHDFWISHTYRYVDLSKAHKLSGAVSNPIEKSMLLQERLQVVRFVSENLQDFYKNHFLKILTQQSLPTVEYSGGIATVFIEGKYFDHDISLSSSSKSLWDYIVLENVPESMVSSLTFRVSYDTRLRRNFEGPVTAYYFTEKLEQIFNNLFKSQRDEKKLKKCLARLCIDILIRAPKVEKEQAYYVEFMNFLTVLRKRKIISATHSKDEIVMLRMILQSFISVLKTIHIQIISKASAAVSKEKIDAIEKNMQENIKRITKVIEQMLKASVNT